MLSEADARAKILERIQPLPTRTVPLPRARRCFTARDIFARLALPVFDNSAMDGYAVIAADCAQGKRLHVIGEQPAGIDRALQVKSGETVRIFTGAPLPAKADAIVMQEDVSRIGDDVVINTEVASG